MMCSRREFLRAGGVGLLAFSVGGCERKLTPSQARAVGATYRVLTPVEVSTIEALGDAILPGAATEGLAHYIDHQLSAPAGQSFLMIKYLGVKPPFLDFYRAGLTAVTTAVKTQFGSEPHRLNPEQHRALIEQLSAGKLPDWQGPPQGLFYFVLRSDAVDIVYGTPAGFEQLGVPYMPHIAPPHRWTE